MPPNKKTQIVDYVRGLILSGQYVPGERLPAVRELASQFHCSLCVVSGALSTLETQGYIAGRQGSGVYVKKQESGRRTVALIGFNNIDRIDQFYQKLIRMTFPPYQKYGYDFMIRTLNLEGSKQDQVLEECKLLLNYIRLDAIILLAPHLHHETLGKLVKLPVPILFPGDFIDGPCKKVAYSSVAFNNRFSTYSGMKALIKHKKSKEYSLFTLPVNYFINENIRGAQQAADEAGVKLNIFSFSSRTYGKMAPDPSVISARKEELEKAEKAGFLAFPSFISSCKEVFREYRGDPGLLFTASSDPGADVELYRAIYHQIEALLQDPAAHKNILLDVTHKLVHLKDLLSEEGGGI